MCRCCGVSPHLPQIHREGFHRQGLDVVEQRMNLEAQEETHKTKLGPSRICHEVLLRSLELMERTLTDVELRTASEDEEHVEHLVVVRILQM